MLDDKWISLKLLPWSIIVLATVGGLADYISHRNNSTALERYKFGNDNAMVSSEGLRFKRQVIYHICGRYPHQFYSTVFCPRCGNNGQDLNADCTSQIQCNIHYGGVTACVNGRCCTADDSGILGGSWPRFDPELPPFGVLNLPSSIFPPEAVFAPDGSLIDPTFGTSNSLTYGYCLQGVRSNIRCSAAGQCLIHQICLNGLCCPRTANDYSHACGGQIALGVCEGGMCINSLTCTPSNYCCQCLVGRSGGRCNQGACAPGYMCTPSDYCCAVCPDRTTPYGECADGKLCGGGAVCLPAGKICCLPPP